MTRHRLKLGLGIVCAASICGAALFAYSAAAVEPEHSYRNVPVDCSQARGIEGADFLRDPDRSICLMSQATFRRLYPEVAEHADESSWAE